MLPVSWNTCRRMSDWLTKLLLFQGTFGEDCQTGLQTCVCFREQMKENARLVYKSVTVSGNIRRRLSDWFSKLWLFQGTDEGTCKTGLQNCVCFREQMKEHARLVYKCVTVSGNIWRRLSDWFCVCFREQMKENARLVLEENQNLLEQINIKDQKAHDLHQAHVKEGINLSCGINDAHISYVSCGINGAHICLGLYCEITVLELVSWILNMKSIKQNCRSTIYK